MLGNMVANALATLLNLLVEGIGKLIGALLEHTLFAQVSLAPGSDLAQALEPVLQGTRTAAQALLSFLLAYGFFRQMLAPSSDLRATHPSVLVPRAVMAVAIGYAARDIVAIPLDIANGITSYFLDLIARGPDVQGTLLGNGTKLAAVAGTGALAWTLIQPVLYLAAAMFLAWVVGSYFVRKLELVFFTGLLPLGAALWTLDIGAGLWGALLVEVLAVIFYQPLQVMLWYLAQRFMFGPAMTPLGAIEAFITGLVALYYMTQVPRLLRQFLGHGIGGGVLFGGEVAAGYLAARGLQGAWGASAAGQTVGSVTAGWRARTQAELAGVEERRPGAAALGGRLLAGLAGAGSQALAAAAAAVPSAGTAERLEGAAAWLGGVRAAPQSLYHALGRQYLRGVAAQSRYGAEAELARATVDYATGRPFLQDQADTLRKFAVAEGYAREPHAAAAAAVAKDLVETRQHLAVTRDGGARYAGQEAAKNRAINALRDAGGDQLGSQTPEEHTRATEALLRQRIARHNATHQYLLRRGGR